MSSASKSLVRAVAEFRAEGGAGARASEQALREAATEAAIESVAACAAAEEAAITADYGTVMRRLEAKTLEKLGEPAIAEYYRAARAALEKAFTSAKMRQLRGELSSVDAPALAAGVAHREAPLADQSITDAFAPATLDAPNTIAAEVAAFTGSSGFELMSARIRQSVEASYFIKRSLAEALMVGQLRGRLGVSDSEARELLSTTWEQRL